jgi:pimeloyl-ACP methyl ester carboxylesterase
VYHRSYQAVAPDPGQWPALVAKVLDLDAQPQDWPAGQVAAIAVPVMLIVADNDIVRLERAVEMTRLLGGGIAGDLHGIPTRASPSSPEPPIPGCVTAPPGWSR